MKGATRSLFDGGRGEHAVDRIGDHCIPLKGNHVSRSVVEQAGAHVAIDQSVAHSRRRTERQVNAELIVDGHAVLEIESRGRGNSAEAGAAARSKTVSNS